MDVLKITSPVASTGAPLNFPRKKRPLLKTSRPSAVLPKFKAGNVCGMEEKINREEFLAAKSEKSSMNLYLV